MNTKEKKTWTLGAPERPTKRAQIGRRGGERPRKQLVRGVQIGGLLKKSEVR